MTADERYAFDTRVIHAGEAPDPSTGAHGVPLYQNSTYAFRSSSQVELWESGALPHYFYARGGNPTVRCFELKMADLEGAEAAAATANGMAAISATIAQLLSCGGHLVVPENLYYFTDEILREDLRGLNASFTRVDITDLDAVEAAIQPDTRAILCETYSNPLMHVADLDGLSAIAKRRAIQVAVDNTFLSPALLRPREHGADIVMHSATKYLAGTGQVMGGVVAGRRDIVGAINARLDRNGGRMTPFAAWLLLAGIKSLPLRMERHSSTALAIARLLQASSEVERVRYPGLETDPGYEAGTRMTGGRHGGLLSFDLHGGRAAVNRFVDALRLCTIAVSLGEATTLVWPNGGAQVRLAVGLEDPDDLIADIRAGLNAVSEDR